MNEKKKSMLVFFSFLLFTIKLNVNSEVLSKRKGEEKEKEKEEVKKCKIKGFRISLETLK